MCTRIKAQYNVNKRKKLKESSEVEQNLSFVSPYPWLQQTSPLWVWGPLILPDGSQSINYALYSYFIFLYTLALFTGIYFEGQAKAEGIC